MTSIIPITQQSFSPGSTSPRTDAIQKQVDMNQRQNDLNQIASGGRRRRTNRRRTNRRGGSNGIAVPQFQMQYAPVGGPGTNPNDQVASGLSTYMQSNTYSENDNKAGMMGGRKWGCYSGGKRSRKFRKNKRNAGRKSKKMHRRRR